MEHKGRQSDAAWVAETLRKAGFQALLAGGCVRDLLLGDEPDDYDVATDATPTEIQAIFPKVLMIGAKFGVAMILRRGRVIETATFRSEADYSDGRRPDSVVFSDAKADALRRDFTINGMFMDPLSGEIIDYVGGKKDLADGVLRAIGDPHERFAEDYLRILRAVRFTARLNFTMDPATFEAARAHAGNLSKISGERIREELEKILSHSDSRLAALEMIVSMDATAQVFGDALARPDAWKTATDRLAELDPEADACTALACLYASQPTGSIRKICRRWGASNAQLRRMLNAAKELDAWESAAGTMALCNFKRLMAAESWQQTLSIWQAEIRRRSLDESSYRRIVQRAAAIATDQVNPAPFIDGRRMMELGLSEGPKLGRILRKLYDMQLNEEITTRRQAEDQAARLIEQDGGGKEE